jgi:hypothetical protein
MDQVMPFLATRSGRKIAALLAVLLQPFPGGAAEFKLTDMDGTWEGVGTERASPMEPAQPVNCQAKIRAESNRMTSDTTCRGQAGLRKVSRMMLTLDGNEITGTLEQTSSTPGSNQAAPALTGSVSGRRTDDTATLQVRFSGLTPSATLTFRFLSPSSYSVQATALGILLMQVAYTKTGKH